MPGLSHPGSLQDARRASDDAESAHVEPRGGHALSVRGEPQADRPHREVLLEQRASTQTVMPGLWELPMLLDPCVPEEDMRMTVRHAIMQVNYYVRIRTVLEEASRP